MPGDRSQEPPESPRQVIQSAGFTARRARGPPSPAARGLCGLQQVPAPPVPRFLIVHGPRAHPLGWGVGWVRCVDALKARTAAWRPALGGALGVCRNVAQWRPRAATLQTAGSRRLQGRGFPVCDCPTLEGKRGAAPSWTAAQCPRCFPCLPFLRGRVFARVRHVLFLTCEPLGVWGRTRGPLSCRVPWGRTVGRCVRILRGQGRGGACAWRCRAVQGEERFGT